jgi:hypothetical protein
VSRDHHAHTAMMRAKRKERAAIVKVNRKKYLSKCVARGMESILQRVTAETEDEFHAMKWLRDTLEDRMSKLSAQDAPSPQRSEGGESQSLSSLGEEAQ